MPSDIADGMNFFDVYEKANAAIARARDGGGPTLLECKTYRYFGHYVGDPLTYRHKEELEDWRQNRDALEHFEREVVEMDLIEPDDLRRIDAEVEAEIDAAVASTACNYGTTLKTLHSDEFLTVIISTRESTRYYVLRMEHIHECQRGNLTTEKLLTRAYQYTL